MDSSALDAIMDAVNRRPEAPDIEDYGDQMHAFEAALRGDNRITQIWLSDLTRGELDYLQVVCQTLVQLIERARARRRDRGVSGNEGE